MNIGNTIKERRTKLGLSQKDLGNIIGLSKQAVSMYERGERTPEPEMLLKIADVLQVDICQMFGRKTIPGFIRPITKRMLPMLGNVACGEPIFAEEEHETYIDADADTQADFCLTAKGDSMINARIFDGDILFVKQQEDVENGEIAVVLIEDEATVKRVYYDKENSIITLVPENPMYKPMRFEGERLNQIHILGKIVSGCYQVE